MKISKLVIWFFILFLVSLNKKKRKMFRNYQNYEIYSDGRIWSYKTNRFLKLATTNKGYKRVWLSDNEGKPKMYLVHRIVYEAVTGEPIPENFEINHCNEDKNDNRFENLNLLTHKENCNFGTRNERVAKGVSKANTNGKRSKMVGAFKNGKLVITFPSINEARRNGFSQSKISECCNGKANTHKGYEWRYI